MAPATFYFIAGVTYGLVLIDSLCSFVQQILYAKDVDQRSVTFEKSIEMGKEYQKRTRAVVLRSLIMKFNISVKVNITNICLLKLLGTFS